MHSISNRVWNAALFSALDDASTSGATFDEVMALLDCFSRVRSEFPKLEYELTSPIGRLAGRERRPAEP
jgi:hypothetical protein